MSISIKLHPKQGRAFESEKKITLCCSGIQGGKTTVGVLWFLRQVSKFQGRDHAFIIGAPTYKILNQSTLPTFFRYAEGLGTYHKVDQEFHFHSGPRVFIRTATDPFSVEGIQNVRAIWLDEAGMCKFSFWVNLEGRAARTNAPIICTTTPYGINWPYQQLIKPLKDGERDDVAYFEWLSIENPTFPIKEYERQKRLLDPRIFRMKYMGMHERMQGLVYELTDDNFCQSFKLPKYTRFYAGVDWGFAEGHEFAISIRAITSEGERYMVDEFYMSGFDPSQQVAACLAKAKLWGVEMFYCDPARPDMIAMLNKGLKGTQASAIGFHVGKDNYKQVIPGITQHVQLIRSGKYKIFKDRCPNACNEYETYHWPEFEDGTRAKENPVKVDDHLMDTERFITVGTMNVEIKGEAPTYFQPQVGKIDRWNPQKKSKQSKAWDSY